MSQVAAIIGFETGSVYRVAGWTQSRSERHDTNNENPAFIHRLSRDGWVKLEEFDSHGGEGRSGLKTQDELIDEALDLITSMYEEENVGVRTVRKKSYPV